MNPAPARNPDEREALDAYSSIVSRVAERAGPAVVKIAATGATPPTNVRGRQGPRRQGPPDEPHAGLGSGVIYSSAGEILTNAHVVAGARTLEVTLPDGRRFAAGLVGAEPNADLAVLRIGARNLPVAQLADYPLRAGQLVVAIGNPFGFDWTITAGVISAVGRNLPLSAGAGLVNLIQIDAAINPGNSGGPLVDSQGRVIGINTAKIPFAQGIGFAIPITTVYQAIGNIGRRPGAKPDRPHLGIGGMATDLDPLLRRRLDLAQQSGVLIVDLHADGPAAQAGLRLLDIIFRVDNKAITGTADLEAAIMAVKPGAAVTIEFLRDGQRRRTTAIVAT
jgi:S1-C subfamily serine protease